MSGTALCPGAIRSTAVNATWQLEAALGCRAANSTTLYNCVLVRAGEVTNIVLQNAEAPEIVAAGRAFYDDYDEFVPIVDDVLIPRGEQRMYEVHDYAREGVKRPLLLGTTRDESALSLGVSSPRRWHRPF